MSALVIVEEALAGQASIDIPASGFVHLLNSDAHSVQDSTGSSGYFLTERQPQTYERWIRARLHGYSRVQQFTFWADNLVVPPGWSVKWGTTVSFANPSGQASSIAVNNVPMQRPNAGNCGGGTPVAGPGTTYSQWIVLQASVTDFSQIAGGALLGSTGTEVVEPILIHYHFGWMEG